jgi:Flp pilus assembly protein TadG
LSAGNGEDAVAFSNAGNAIPNRKGGSVNAGEQTIKMPRNLFNGMCGFNPLLSKNAALPSFARVQGLKHADKGANCTVTFTRWCKRLGRRMRGDSTKGSASIEFAMVAPAFFLLLMGTMEAALVFFAQSTLQNAVNDTARLIRTGQTTCFTGSGSTCAAMTQAQFRTQVCSEAGAILSDCSGSSLQFDVNAYSAGFSGAGNTSPLDGSGNLPALSNFNMGSPCEVVLVRAFYKWPVFTPMLNFFLANMAGNYHLLSTAAAFRNEPYNNSVPGC